MDLKNSIREVPDFPKPGISFKDITTLLETPDAFRFAVNQLLERFASVPVDAIAAIESRGFIFAAPMAIQRVVPLALVRKPGKLPARTIAVQYELEYGTDTLEIHKDAVSPGMNVVLIDDLLATGGTALAAAQLIEQLGATVSGIGFVVELTQLGGRKKLGAYRVETLVEYDDAE